MPDVQVSVGTERELPAVVVRKLLAQEQDPASGGRICGRLATRTRPRGCRPRRSVELDVGEAPRGVEGQPEQPLLVPVGDGAGEVEARASDRHAPSRSAHTRPPLPTRYRASSPGRTAIATGLVDRGDQLQPDPGQAEAGHGALAEGPALGPDDPPAVPAAVGTLPPDPDPHAAAAVSRRHGDGRQDLRLRFPRMYPPALGPATRADTHEYGAVDTRGYQERARLRPAAPAGARADEGATPKVRRKFALR